MQDFVDEPVIPFILIGLHKQHNYYEGEISFCKNCGRLIHVVTNCQYKRVESSASTTLTCTSMPQPNECNDVQNINGEVWQTVNFSKKKKTMGEKTRQSNNQVQSLNYHMGGQVSLLFNLLILTVASLLIWAISKQKPMSIMVIFLHRNTLLLKISFVPWLICQWIWTVEKLLIQKWF